MKQSETIARKLVDYVEANPKCTRYRAEFDCGVTRDSYRWETVKHLFNCSKSGKSYFYTRNNHEFSMHRPKKRTQYAGISERTIRIANRIELLLEKGASYTGSEIQRMLKITLSAYKVAILQAKVMRYTIKGNGYLYAAAGSVQSRTGNTKTADIAESILKLIAEEAGISAENIRSKLDIDIIVFRCAMKLIKDKVLKNYVNYKPCYRLIDAARPVYDGGIEKIEIRETPPTQYNGAILTQWRTTPPWVDIQ
jgi:hypothetical protein